MNSDSAVRSVIVMSVAVVAALTVPVAAEASPGHGGGSARGTHCTSDLIRFARGQDGFSYARRQGRFTLMGYVGAPTPPLQRYLHRHSRSCPVVPVRATYTRREMLRAAKICRTFRGVDFVSLESDASGVVVATASARLLRLHHPQRFFGVDVAVRMTDERAGVPT